MYHGRAHQVPYYTVWSKVSITCVHPHQSYEVPTTQPTIGYIYVLAESIVGSNQLSSTCQGLNIQTPTGVNAICLW